MDRCPPHTAASRGAATAATLLGVLLLLVLVLGGPDALHARVVVGSFGVVQLTMATRLWVANCAESRLACDLLAVATAVGALLAATIGLPGSDRVGGGVPWALVVLGALVPVLLAADTGARHRPRRTVPDEPPPYAL